MRRKNQVNSRKFLVTIQWSYDHQNTECATFTIEGDAEENDPSHPLFYGKPLGEDNWLLYLEKYQLAIEARVRFLCEAVNGNPMSACACRPMKLYAAELEFDFVVPMSEGHEKFTFECVELCTFYPNGVIKLPKEE